jgi:glucose/arabinose dehydrogenase
MKRLFTSLALIFYFASCAQAQPSIELVNFVSGFTRPVDIANCGDDRLFIVEQRGIIWIVDKNGNKLPNAFLNIDPSVGSSGNEQGLLGLAFHPNYAENGYFYVNYTMNNGDTRVSRFTVQAGNPNQADPASEMVLFEVDQPFSNHNGGCVKFGPDGYLYIGLGDGGSGGDPQNNGQKRMTMLGKMLRIDVDGGVPYAIPADNPFADDDFTMDEIWALGLRNPWRFSFDRNTGDLWIGDVGQDAWEEIDFQPASSTGGENYGWRCYEGNHVYNTNNCDPMNTMTFPVAEYVNGASCSVTGGFVYRGCNFPELYGHYLYTDYCTGIIWSLTPNGSGGWNNQQLANLNDFQFVSFGENRNGELFLAGLGNGIIYRVTETTELFDYEISVTDVVCPTEPGGSISLNFSGSNDPVQVEWSTGATGAQLDDLQAGSYTVTITGGNGCTATETIEVGSTIQFASAFTNENCPGDADGTITLTVTGNVEPVTASWSDGSNDLNRTSLSAGSYSVTLTTDEGCTLLENFTIETNFESPATPVISVEMDTVLSAGTGYASYQWLLNGIPIAGATQESFTATESGDYSVVVSNNGGCEATSEPVTVTISGIVNLPNIGSVKLTPNPFGQTIRMDLTASQPVSLTIQITDIQGKTWMEKQLPSQRRHEEKFDLQALPSGVYFFTLKTEGGEWTERIVKGY